MSFLLHTNHFITFLGFIFPGCLWKTNENLTTPLHYKCNIYLLQTFSEIQKITENKIEFEVVWLKFNRKRNQMHMLHKRLCDFFFSWKCILGKSKQYLISIILFLPALAAGRAKHCLHGSLWDSPESCRWGVPLLCPIFSVSCSLIILNSSLFWEEWSGWPSCHDKTS